VISSHWLPKTNIFKTIPNGAIGMDLFFVLSGFLITRILLSSKLKMAEVHATKTSVLKKFYLNRMLRIFPIYYISLILLLIFEKYTGTNIKTTFIYYFTYTQNFLFFSRGSWDGIISHFWSLAVEEQFYLLWPFIVLFVNKKYILHALILLISIGFMSQLVFANIQLGNTLTFICFDALGLGALLAWQITFHPKQMPAFLSRLKIITLICLAFFLFQLQFTELRFFTPRAIFPILALFIISSIVYNHHIKKPQFELILNNRLLLLIGKISYGLYIYHNLVPYMLNSKLINVYVNPLLPDFLNIKHHAYLYFVENCTLLMLISWLSYVFIEKPFLRLKKSSTSEISESTILN
jgi:peptidoglycan/LPS O-acetylase OafA/YrhL